MPKSPARALDEPIPSPAVSACSAADALFRAAGEGVRQHERLGRCLELACSDNELQHVAEQTELSDVHLEAMTGVYEKAADVAKEAKNEAWWHAANGLWHASREYLRRNAGGDHVSRLGGKHHRAKLGELAVEYELERSALMALKQAVSVYRGLRADRE